MCTLAKNNQKKLNKYQLSTSKRLEKDVIVKTKTTTYKSIVYKNKTNLHRKPRDALCCIQCPNVDGFSVPHFKFILQEYTG